MSTECDINHARQIIGLRVILVIIRTNLRVPLVSETLHLGSKNVHSVRMDKLFDDFSLKCHTQIVVLNASSTVKHTRIVLKPAKFYTRRDPRSPPSQTPPNSPINVILAPRQVQRKSRQINSSTASSNTVLRQEVVALQECYTLFCQRHFIDLRSFFIVYQRFGCFY